MFDPTEYIEAYKNLPHGTERLSAIANAVSAADEANDAKGRLYFRLAYLRESFFACEDTAALSVLNEVLEISDAHSELTADERLTTMKVVRDILEQLPQYADIAESELDSYADAFAVRCEQYGYSPRALRFLSEKRAVLTGHMPPAEELGTFADEQKDELSECEAREFSFQVFAALQRGDKQTAAALSKPIFSGELRGENALPETYAAWIADALKNGDYGLARRYARTVYPMVHGNKHLLSVVGLLLRVYAKVDRTLGCNILRRELENFLTCKCDYQRMQFALGAYRLFAGTESPEVSLVLTKSFPLFESDSRYQIAKLRGYFYEEAKASAERLDARSGNTAYMKQLQGSDAKYRANAKDYTHGYAEPEASVLGALCKKLPARLNAQSVMQLLNSDGRMHVELTSADPQNNALQFQITEGEYLFRVAVTVEPPANIMEFRPATPVPTSLQQTAKNAEGTVICLMPYDEIQPDIALHFQMKFLQMLCPDALVFLDITRRKLLDKDWMAMEAYSQVPPLVDYLYNLSLYGGENDDTLWILTEGFRCCGMREIEILDANKENYPRLCDFLCFTAERLLLQGELPDAGEPFTVVQKQDGTPVVCTWLPVSKALAYYPKEDAGCTKARAEMLGKNADELADNAVLFLYDGETMDGTPKLKRLGTLTAEDFEQLCYGQFIATGEKTAALAKERYDIFAKCVSQPHDEAYAAVQYETDEDSDEIWMKVTAADAEKIVGTLADDCLAGKQGDAFTAERDALRNFSVKNKDIVVQPNTAYLGEIQ